MRILICRLLLTALTSLALTSCSTPTLVQIARRRAVVNEENKAYWGLPERSIKDDVRIKYTVTDMDVMNFADEVQRKLANRANLHMGYQYGAVGTQTTLGALAGAARTFGWGTATASGLGLGATYVFGLSRIFDSKAHAQAYDQARNDIGSAEADFFRACTGMTFVEVAGRRRIDPASGSPTPNIPSRETLSPAGETLYYRVTKVLKVLNDTLMAKIPELEDLEVAKGVSASNRGTFGRGNSDGLKDKTGSRSERRQPNDTATDETDRANRIRERMIGGDGRTTGKVVAPQNGLIFPKGGQLWVRLANPDGSTTEMLYSEWLKHPKPKVPAGSPASVQPGGTSPAATQPPTAPTVTPPTGTQPITTQPVGPNEVVTIDPSTGKPAVRFKKPDGTIGYRPYP